MEEPLPILVVEDEYLVQETIGDDLNEGGFGVVMAWSGEEAVELFEADEAKYRALVADIKLGQGRMAGWEVAKRARQIDPAFPVVYMTSDSANDWAANGAPTAFF